MRPCLPKKTIKCIVLSSMCSVPIAELHSLKKEYRLGETTIQVLRGVDLSVCEQDFIAIMGSSGSGKSTLLHIIGCLDRPDSGTYFLDGRDVSNLNDNELSAFRKNYVSFVFQDFNLLPYATVYENVALPFLYSSVDPIKRKQHILQAIEDVGLSHRLSHRPNALSGGERQRVAIARAVAVRPKLILADEPTGNLDYESSREILTLLTRLHEKGATVILVTHDHEVASAADSIAVMKNGLLQGLL